MKQSIEAISKKLSFLFASLLLSFLTFAQDKKVDVDITTKGDGDAGGMMGQPWIWVVGGAVFIIILVAIIRGNSNK